jgi:hypothetical protein
VNPSIRLNWELIDTAHLHNGTWASGLRRRASCVHPTACKMLDTSHGPTKRLMKKTREINGIKNVHIASHPGSGVEEMSG